MGDVRDLGVVLSGGGINGVLLELGFLQELRRSPLWERVGWIYGTSAGALSGMMGAVDRLDDLEEFLLELQPEEVFSPNPMWQAPLGGLRGYALPGTISERLGDPSGLAEAMRSSPIELVVVATDVGVDGGSADGLYELVFRAHETPPETMIRAVLASAAVSALVLPVRIDERTIATDGGWVRNLPLGHAYDNPDVRAIVGFRYVASYGPTASPTSTVAVRFFKSMSRRSRDTSSEMRQPVEYSVSSTARSRSFQNSSPSGHGSRLGISIEPRHLFLEEKRGKALLGARGCGSRQRDSLRRGCSLHESIPARDPGDHPVDRPRGQPSGVEPAHEPARLGDARPVRRPRRGC